MMTMIMMIEHLSFPLYAWEMIHMYTNYINYIFKLEQAD